LTVERGGAAKQTLATSSAPMVANATLILHEDHGVGPNDEATTSPVAAFQICIAGGSDPRKVCQGTLRAEFRNIWRNRRKGQQTGRGCCQRVRKADGPPESPLHAVHTLPGRKVEVHPSITQGQGRISRQQAVTGCDFPENPRVANFLKHPLGMMGEP
jgi:hypothetical protein